MKRRRAILLCAVALGGLLVVLAYQGSLIKPSVNITLVDETVPVQTVPGENVCLLCRPEQITGILFVAEAVEASGNTFKRFEDNREIYLETSGETPFDVLNEEVVLYSDNLWVLRGDLRETTEDAVYHLNVVDWEAVTPVRSIFRVWPFTRGLFTFDYRETAGR